MKCGQTKNNANDFDLYIANNHFADSEFCLPFVLINRYYLHLAPVSGTFNCTF